MEKFLRLSCHNALTQAQHVWCRIGLAPILFGFFQPIDVPALVMLSCESVATSPSSLNTVKTKDEQKKSLQRQPRYIEKFACMDRVFKDRQKEIWKEELQEIERKRTELLPEQKMQKRSLKLQSLQDKQRNHLMNACACEEEMQMLSEEVEERKALFETRLRALSEKSGDSWKAAGVWEVEI